MKKLFMYNSSASVLYPMDLKSHKKLLEDPEFDVYTDLIIIAENGMEAGALIHAYFTNKVDYDLHDFEGEKVYAISRD